MRALHRFALCGAALLATACNGLGEGNTVKKLELVPASSARLTTTFEQGDTYPLYTCLRDELSLVGTFMDGQRVQFNSRAKWSSSDESVVLVSNRDINVVTVLDGEFTELTTLPYAAGTLIPVGEVGQEAVITAEFVGLSASIRVRLEKPQLRIVPAPYPLDQNPLGFTGPVYAGVGTRQRLTLFGNFAGRLAFGLNAGALNSSINPVLWKFTNGEFEADDTDAISDYDKWSVPDAASRYADIDGGGTIRARIASAGEYAIEAQTSLCPAATDPDLKPTASLRVLPFAQASPFTIHYQPDFHAPGSFTPASQFGVEDIADGTAQFVGIIGHLDLDGDGLGDIEQDLSTQAAFDIVPRDAGCDAKGVNCLVNSLAAAATGSGLLTVGIGTGGRLNDGYDLVCLTDPENPECSEEDDPDIDPISVQACLPACPSRLASLSAENPISGPVVSLTATTFNLDGARTFVFDCDDGTGPQSTGQVANIDCDYTGDTGPFTPTVRVIDSGYAATMNAGAVQVQLDPAPAGNTAPTAVLEVSPEGGAAPLTVLLSGAKSTQSDADDSITVYEFQPEPGVFVRQTSSSLYWVYYSQPAAEPSLVVYDEHGVASAADSAELTVELSAGPLRRSPPITVRVVDVQPCAMEVLPPEPAVETAFTFPGSTFKVVASFIAQVEDDGNADTDPCDTEPLVGTQDVTRYVTWTVRPDEDSTEVNPNVSIRASTNDFQDVGQTLWFSQPEEEITPAVIATPLRGTVFANLEAPPAVYFTLQPCAPEQCTE